jgi:very-short-patch-repair endonuclease
VVEATVGRAIVDMLLPTQRVVIEVDGGVHMLTVANDARRRAALEAHGLRVIVLADRHGSPLTTEASATVIAAVLSVSPTLLHVSAHPAELVSE